MLKEWNNPQFSVIRNDELRKTIIASACSSNSTCVINVVCGYNVRMADQTQF